MIGRNDPCHCGSGKKYKKCHLPGEQAVRLAEARGAARPIPPEVVKQFAAVQAADKAHVDQYGHARQTVHADFQGHKFVAVGGALHWSSQWRNFTDFLLDYIKKTLNRAFGPEWYGNERQKPAEKRHPIVRWFEAFCELGSRTERNAAGMLEATPDGPTQAYITLAYDLYTVADNAALQNELLTRLRDPQRFHGARYELAVAAIMIRAGFDIEFEDESDNTRRHAEFVATHRATGVKVSVEAKARRRSGVMGWIGPRQDPAVIKLSVDSLLRDACEKNPDLPLVVFIDANMPPEMVFGHLKSWLLEIQETLPRVGHGYSKLGVFEGAPFALLVLTNIPYDYARPGEIATGAVGYSSQPHPARRPIPNQELVSAIEKAVEQYGVIPQDFADDPRNKDAV
jgi:hypothetical protein